MLSELRLPRFAEIPGTKGRTAIMGILNVTPDSFSDGGRFSSAAAAIDAGLEMTDAGAGVIDVGGESTRPNAPAVSVDVELERTIAVVEALASRGVVVSIDTRKADVARFAVSAGAIAVNDVSGGSFDPAMIETVSELDCDFVIMHSRGAPTTMDGEVDYGADVVGVVQMELRSKVDLALAFGVKPERIWIDPGLGFAKTTDQSVELLARIGELKALGYPILVGPSRKRFVGAIDNIGGASDGPESRDAATMACVAWTFRCNVDMVRVHNVADTALTLRMLERIRSASNATVLQ